MLLTEYERHLGDALLTKARHTSGHLCIVQAEDSAQRQEWRGSLTRSHIAWGHHYPMNHEQRTQCPEAFAKSVKIITLPLHVGMNVAAVRRVCRRLIVP